MRRLALASVPRWLLAGLLLVVPSAGLAQAPVSPAGPDSLAGSAKTPPDTRDTATQLADARELIKNGDYDHAIEALRYAVANSAGNPEQQREAYLLLIKTYVFLGNDYKFKPQGREASNLNYRAARELIAECLSIPALRRTQPEPATDYPPEMIGFFAEVRSRLFGAFRVVGLEPVTAVVLFDGDTLHASGDGVVAADDLPVGSHEVAVRAPGHKDLTETVTISPGSTLERSYRLEKKRGAGWYAARIGGGLAIIGGTIALIAGNKKDGTTTTEEPLPGAPPPPPTH
jgi:hypothetical protein